MNKRITLTRDLNILTTVENGIDELCPEFFLGRGQRTYIEDAPQLGIQ